MGLGWDWADEPESKQLAKDAKEGVKETIKRVKKKHDSLVDNWGGFSDKGDGDE